MLADIFTPYRPRKVEGITVGQKIKVTEKVVLPDNTYLHVSSDYVVTKIHPFVVETRRRTDKRLETRCFSIGDLVTLGLVPGGGST